MHCIWTRCDGMKKFMIMTMVQKNGKCIKVVGNKVVSCSVKTGGDSASKEEHK